jgi:uncharacterized membrane protein
MSALPSIPGWDGIHPLMVQFTVVLFCVTPVLLLVTLLSRKAWDTWARATLLVMTMGAIASWLAVASGHAAAQLVDKTVLLQHQIAAHEALGVQARNVFTLFTVAFALLVFLPAWLRRTLPTPARLALYASFLVVGCAGGLVIGGAASLGGRLVHESGVRAMIVPAEPAAAVDPNAAAPEPKHETAPPPPAP